MSAENIYIDAAIKEIEKLKGEIKWLKEERDSWEAKANSLNPLIEANKKLIKRIEGECGLLSLIDIHVKEKKQLILQLKRELKDNNELRITVGKYLQFQTKIKEWYGRTQGQVTSESAKEMIKILKEYN